MKAVILKSQGGTEQLMMADLPIPHPGNGEVLIKVHAIGINPTDVYARQDSRLDYIFNGESPKILGWDISGEIVEIGADTAHFKVGDAVFGLLNFPTYTTPGHAKGYAEYVVASINDIALKPANISYEEAAAVPMAALTVWQPLNKFRIKPGDRVFITAVGGGVGHFAVQLAKYFGAYVIALASGAKREFVLGLGADEFIDYQTTNFLDILSSVDYVIEGLRDEHIAKSMQALKDGATLLSLWDHIVDSKWADLAVQRNINAFYNNVVSNGQDIKALARLLEEQKLVPHISKRFGLDEIPLAHSAIESNHTTGKVIIKVL